MRCLVTAGPTFEPLDQVRRLTNFSTGRLGSELADHLHTEGHDVTLLLGEQATWPGPATVTNVRRFSSTQTLADQIAALADSGPFAVFHTSAVSDFAFGRIWETGSDGERRELTGGKITTRAGNLLAELVPTPKLIARLREWFPQGFLVGWKYEVDGDRAAVIEKAGTQITENHIDLCIANGPAYGEGFGIVNPAGETRHCPTRRELFAALSERLAQS